MQTQMILSVQYNITGHHQRQKLKIDEVYTEVILYHIN